MQLAGVSTAGSFGNLRFRSSYSSGGATNATARDYAPDRVALRDLFSDLDRLRDEVDGLAKAASGFRRSRRGGGTASTTSSASLGLNLTSTYSSLTSATEINTDSTSFGPTNPSFSGGSSSSPTIGGTYDGSNGDDTLTFNVTRGGTVGFFSALELEVRDSQGTLIDTVNYSAFTPAGTVATLSNGLEVSFSSGSLSEGDSFDVTVSNSTQNTIDPERSFAEGAGTDPGFTIQDGSFTINGIDITVNTTDSLNDVLTRIQSSSAGVDATFDVDSDRVVLTSQTSGSAGEFTLGPDSSGLVAALKLDTAVLERADDDERSLALDQVLAFSSVNSGTFTVNGVNIAVDTSVDSLNDVLARIESTVSGVDAYFHSGSGKVRIESTIAGNELSLGDGDSGFISALNLGTGTKTTEASTKKLSGVDSADFELRLDSLSKRLAEVLGRRDVTSADVATGSLRTKLVTGLNELFQRQKLQAPLGSQFESGIGINLDLQFKSTERVTFDIEKFRNAVSQKPAQVLKFLTDEEADKPGFITLLTNVLDETEAGLVAKYGADAQLLDVLA